MARMATAKVHTELIKHDLDDWHQQSSTTTPMPMDGKLGWQYPPEAYLNLYQASAEHAAAIQIKAEVGFGLGIKADSGIDKLEALCPLGLPTLLTDIGMDLECFGNCFVELVRTPGDGRLLKIQRLPAHTIRRLSTGGYIQRVYAPDGTEQTIKLKAESILHLRSTCPQGYYYALPPWVAAGNMIELVRAATAYNKRFFQNSAIPEYAVITKGFEISEAQKEALRQFLADSFRGVDNAHRTVYLHIGDEPHSSIEFKRVNSEMQDGDFLKLLDSARDRIITAHRVPPRLLAIITAGQLGGGSEVASQLWLFDEFTLEPRRRRVLAQLKPIFDELGVTEPKIIRPDITPPEHDRKDRDQLANWVQTSIITPAEAREMLELDKSSATPKANNATDPFPGVSSPSNGSGARDSSSELIIKALGAF